ncbi:MAG TPA: cytochrome c oxidase subunit 3 [Pyrinomonadaceae bacterium]|nr:cytochrome c oxidase subunit 3 [Pyrinomonadaceae bacterium]
MAEAVHTSSGHPASAHAALQHHFENMEQQREAGTLGMWIFLVTEIMFFGGMFMAYILYRAYNADAFAAASNALNVRMGFANTIVLICSSLTMALAVYYSQVGKRMMIVVMLILTMILGTAFLVVKAFEYYDKYEKNEIQGRLFPSKPFKWEQAGHGSPAKEPARDGSTERNPQSVQTGQEQKPDTNFASRVEMFFFIYFAMTGLHALHMVIGIGMLIVLTWMAWRDRFSPEYHAPVELGGLYWHFVDIVWIFLFPLLYLLGAHGVSGGGGH